MITIDELKSISEKHDIHPSYLGLGIVRLKFPESGEAGFSKNRLAYHFYSERTDPVWDFHPIHDHVFTFTSTVLKGTLRSWIYSYEVAEEETNYSLNTIPYQQKDIEVIHENINPIEVCKFDTVEGVSYSIDYTTLHHVERMTPYVITMVDKGPPPTVKQNSFQYIQDKRTPYVDTFKYPKPVDECWDIIEEVLNG
jgi:hypothetical protein